MPDLDLVMTGDRELGEQFAQLPLRVQTRVLKPLVAEASERMAEAIGQEAPERTGLMRLAAGSSAVKLYTASKMIFATAGIRWGFRRTMTRTKAGRLRFVRGSRPEAGAAGAIDPARYQYPVQKGHKQGGGQVAAIPFTEKAFEAKGRQILADLEEQIDDGLAAAVQQR